MPGKGGRGVPLSNAARSQGPTFTTLVRCIPRSRVLLDAVVNGVFFLISLSGSSSLVHGNAPGFCILPLYTDLFIGSHSVWVEGLGQGVQPAAHRPHTAQDGHECGPTRNRKLKHDEFFV